MLEIQKDEPPTCNQRVGGFSLLEGEMQNE